MAKPPWYMKVSNIKYHGRIDGPTVQSFSAYVTISIPWYGLWFYFYPKTLWDIIKWLIFDEGEMIELTKEEKERFERWIIENVWCNVIPGDENNDDAFRYNLIHLLRGDGKEWDYKPEQRREIEELEKMYEVSTL